MENPYGVKAGVPYPAFAGSLGGFGRRDTRPTSARKQREKAAKIMKSLTGSRVDKALDGPYLSPQALLAAAGLCRGRAGEPRNSLPALTLKDSRKGLSPHAIPEIRLIRV